MTKSLSLQRLPPVLVLHLKRFSARGYRRSKLTVDVRFPIGRHLDLGPFCDPAALGSRRYELYGVVNHGGGLTGGHYTATCRHPNGRWYGFNDRIVTDVAEA